ncbi:phosphatidylserine decarboxylase [Candidatus Margulisiibacteriota bacterium]
MSKIFLFNRKTDSLEEEIVFEERIMKFLFNTTIGFFLTEYILKWRFISLIYGFFQNTNSSGKKIKKFISNYNINTEEILHSPTSFKTFNDFFTRKLKTSARPINTQKDIFIAPADARLLAYHFQEDLVIPVKGKGFTISELLRTTDFNAQYKNGTCLVFRLAPVDYHRFCYIDNCQQSEIKSIKGFYRGVSPLSLSKGTPVFPENYREYCILNTENFGQVIHIDVGAIGVGKIVQHNYNQQTCQKGEEKGYFEFGGSTIVLLVQEGIVKIDDDVEKYSLKGIETIVRYGEQVGKVL